MHFLRCSVLSVTLGAALIPLPAAATGTISSFARAYVGGQVCGAGPAPNCLTTELYNDLSNPVEVTTADAQGQFLAERRSGYYFPFDSENPSNFGVLENWAQADLNQGNLRLTAMATVPPRPAGSDPTTAQPYVYGFASAWLGDTFAVLNPNGSAYSGAANSTLSINLDGNLFGTPESDLGFVASITLARPGYLAALAAHDYDTAGNLIVNSAYTDWLTANSPLPPTLSIAVPAAQGSFEWMVSAFITYNFRQDDQGFNFVYADLGHTITVSLQTPQGTVFSSASGLFPGSIPAAPVPEPASWALLLIGGAGTLALARRPRAVGAETALA